GGARVFARTKLARGLVEHSGHGVAGEDFGSEFGFDRPGFAQLFPNDTDAGRGIRRLGMGVTKTSCEPGRRRPRMVERPSAGDSAASTQGGGKPPLLSQSEHGRNCAIAETSP